MHRLVSDGCALFTAHTNADSPAGGVSESLALALGLEHVRPLEPDPGPAPTRSWCSSRSTRPTASAPRWRTPARARSATTTRASFTLAGRGPLPPARRRPPGDRRGRPGRGGRRGARSRPCARATCAATAIAAMLAAHPYEEPAYDVVELAAARRTRPGLGPDRPARRADDAARVRRACRPTCSAETAHGVRVAGDPDQMVETVGAVRRRRGLPARPGARGGRRRLPDLRPAPPPGLGAARARRRPALVDVAHWAAEATWLPVLRRSAGRGAGRYGGGPRQHDQHRPVDLPGLRSHNSRRLL